MIITRAPLRVSFAGGGSDLPAFYREEPGAVFSATITAYMYIALNRKFEANVRLSYSKTENVGRTKELEHDLARETFALMGIERSVEVVSVADVPAGTGLGSSSTYTVALLQAIAAQRQHSLEPSDLARLACEVEIERCQHPIGQQDQYAAAFGGMRLYEFTESGVSVGAAVEPLLMDELAKYLMLIYTGNSRDAHTILTKQSQMSKLTRMLTRELVPLAQAMHHAVTHLDLDEFARLLREEWNIKRQLRGVTSDEIDLLLAKACQAGALSGKLCGAGGNGFLLLFVPPEKRLAVKEQIEIRPIRELRFGFESNGSQVIYDSREQ